MSGKRRKGKKRESDQSGPVVDPYEDDYVEIRTGALTGEQPSVEPAESPNDLDEAFDPAEQSNIPRLQSTEGLPPRAEDGEAETELGADNDADSSNPDGETDTTLSGEEEEPGVVEEPVSGSQGDEEVTKRVRREDVLPPDGYDSDEYESVAPNVANAYEKVISALRNRLSRAEEEMVELQRELETSDSRRHELNAEVRSLQKARLDAEERVEQV
ncbi:MAG: hypothetical protein KC561_12770, partial [Myxococcales bacterium]|nr:hypothetical protein [Myxococcales bacterium]